MITKVLQFRSKGQGLLEITAEVEAVVRTTGVRHGLCVLFVRHTSCSLLIQENADPSARHDLERWLNRMVPEGDPIYQHTAEGTDDMPAHIKAALTPVSLTIPVLERRPALGTWQGIYLWEHRIRASTREVVISVMNGDGST